MALHVLARGAALEEPRAGREEPPVVDGEVHLEVDDRLRLADVAHLQVLEVVAGRPRSRRRPWRAVSKRWRGVLLRPLLECGLGRGDRVVDVGRVARRDLVEQLARRGLEHLVDGAAASRHPLPADEVAACHRSTSAFAFRGRVPPRRYSGREIGTRGARRAGMMCGVVAPGRVVVLNGTSSSGKTSAAQAFQQARADAGECWVVVGMDDFMPKLPRRWVKVGTWAGSIADDGVRLDRAGDRARFHIGRVDRRRREPPAGDRIDRARARVQVRRPVHRFPARTTLELRLHATVGSRGGRLAAGRCDAVDLPLRAPAVIGSGAEVAAD